MAIRIAAVGCALPPHRLSQRQAKAFASRHFAAASFDVARYLPVFDHAGIKTRRLCAPLSLWAEDPGFGRLNDLYIEWACRLGERAARACLRRARAAPEEVAHIVFVSTTGLAAPSLDARLAGALGLEPHATRAPLWGLGCAGGVSGLALAGDYARAHPGRWVLLVTAELCSLTFQPKELSKKNLVASALFADGAAAVLLREEEGVRGPELIGAQSTLWKGTEDIMGWDVVDTGFRVVFSNAIPRLVRERVRAEAERLLAANGLTLAQVRHLVLHPGGTKVMQAYEGALRPRPGALRHAWDVLREHGNMSSASVFFVLDRFLRSKSVRPGEYGLLAALGPGFSCELALMRF